MVPLTALGPELELYAPQGLLASRPILAGRRFQQSRAPMTAK
jgi:hypothetical protein